MKYAYEIFLKHGQIGVTEWNQFLLQIAKYLDGFAKWEIRMQCDHNVIHYYLLTPQIMPASLDLIDFLLKPCPEPPSFEGVFRGIYLNKWNDNFVTLAQNLRKRQYRIKSVSLRFSGIHKFLSGSIRISYARHNENYQQQLLLFAPAKLLSVDFDKSKAFLFKKFPKYLKLEKVTRLLSDKSENALLEVDSFPYSSEQAYLHLASYDFAKHSLVIGGSGSGKSKFLASLIDKVYQAHPENYKIVVIDPHDALYQDCMQIPSKAVINFQNLTNSIDLFQCRADDINAGVELMLTLFRSIMNDSYNGRLERVLRYATYLLITAEKFSFLTLRKLLLDLAYRNEILSQCQHQLPASVAHFFLTDFNELKAQSYNDAIAPIVAFIDEMQMVPVFNSEAKLADLSQKVRDNFLNIFSLNRLKLGNKVAQTIAGLLMQQLFLLAEQKLPQHLLIIIDEVSVVENPIIACFLSELRKYNTSVILAGQYFDQISPDLRSAIFANTSNYYLFRVSQSDANLLTQNLKIKIEGSDNPDDQCSLLTGLKPRECLVRISSDEELLPVFKAHTTDFAPVPDLNQSLDLLEQPFDFPSVPVTSTPEDELLDQTFTFPSVASSLSQSVNPSTPSTPSSPEPPVFDFQVDDAVNVDDFTKTYSSSRKIKKKES